VEDDEDDTRAAIVVGSKLYYWFQQKQLELMLMASLVTTHHFLGRSPTASAEAAASVFGPGTQNMMRGCCWSTQRGSTRVKGSLSVLKAVDFLSSLSPMGASSLSLLLSSATALYCDRIVKGNCHKNFCTCPM
jgi:hypothetical protein